MCVSRKLLEAISEPHVKHQGVTEFYYTGFSFSEQSLAKRYLIFTLIWTNDFGNGFISHFLGPQIDSLRGRRIPIVFSCVLLMLCACPCVYSSPEVCVGAFLEHLVHEDEVFSTKVFQQRHLVARVLDVLHHLQLSGGERGMDLDWPWNESLLKGVVRFE